MCSRYITSERGCSKAQLEYVINGYVVRDVGADERQWGDRILVGMKVCSPMVLLKPYPPARLHLRPLTNAGGLTYLFHATYRWPLHHVCKRYEPRLQIHNVLIHDDSDTQNEAVDSKSAASLR